MLGTAVRLLVFDFRSLRRLKDPPHHPGHGGSTPCIVFDFSPLCCLKDPPHHPGHGGSTPCVVFDFHPLLPHMKDPLQLLPGLGVSLAIRLFSCIPW